LAIEIASGKLAEYQSANPEMALGNLICYRGSILSQSALVLDKFEQLDILRQRAESALADNPNDATALRELAELKRADGDTPQAVKLLKQAFELAPDDPLAREMLAELLLEALASQYANYRDDVPLLSKLIHDREQQIELRRIAARGLEQLGDRLAAFDAHLRLADFTAEEPAYLRVGSDYSVRSDRWICGRLGSLWRDATDDERSAMADRLISRRPKLEDPRTAAELRHYLWHMAQLPGADEVRLALAKLLVDRKRAQEAEIELLELSACTDDEIRTAAAELMSKLVAESRPRDATNTSARWPHGRVDAELVPAPARMADGAARLQAERQSGYAQVRIEQDFSPNCKSVQWFVAMDCSELVGRTGLGEDVFQLAIDQNSWPQQQRDSSLVHAGRLGQLLFVALGGQVTAIDARHGGPGVAGSVLWQTDPNGRLSGELMHGRRTGTSPPRSGRRPVYHAYSGRKRMTGVVGTAVSSLGPVTPGGVVFQEHDQLKCVDPLSGEVLWIRTDIPAGCELFGDKERLFAADVSGRVAHVISMLDGRRLGSRPLPRFEWLITASRNVAELGFQINRNRHVLLLRISDIWSQDVLYEAEHPRATRTAVVEPNYIAIYEPTGRFQLIDVRSGKSAIDEQLEAMPDVLNIYTMQSGDELYLLISNPPQQQFRPLVQQPDYPLVNGLVYAFNMTTGEPQWPGPALVRSRGIVLSQPQDMPLLVFADRRLIRDAARGGGSQLRVLCLDKRTGQTAYRNDSLPDTSITRFRVRAARDLKSTVAVEMSAGKIQLALTNQPRPPQPPANDDLEAPREVQQRGLRGIGERMSGALRGALDNKPADRRNELQRQLQEFQRGRQQAREKLLETDDD
jgi:tetratricopeptide (TPR) repeat protein/outer membrane protein assembly factor BamB